MEPSPPTAQAPQTPTKPKPKIIETIPMLIIAVVTIGPFALPLLWRNPRFSKKVKIGWSLLIIFFTLWLLKFGKDMIESLTKELTTSIGQ